MSRGFSFAAMAWPIIAQVPAQMPNHPRGYYASPPPSAVDAFPPWLAFVIFLAFALLAVWLWWITPRRGRPGQKAAADRELN